VAKDRGTLYLFSEAHSDARVAAIGLSADETGDAFVKYVSKRPLDPVIESAMFKVPNLKDEDEVAEVLDDLAFVGDIAINQDLPWVDTDATITTTTKLKPRQVTVSAAEGSRNASVNMDQEFIGRIATLSPSERDWKAYQEFERQLGTNK